MNNFDQIWKRLLALARLASAAEELLVAPPGLATRIAALAVAARREAGGAALWELFAVRGLAVACVLMVVSAVMAWPLMTGVPSEDLAALADPLAEVALLE